MFSATILILWMLSAVTVSGRAIYRAKPEGAEMVGGNMLTPKGAHAPKALMNEGLTVRQPAQRADICTERIIIHITAQARVAKNRSAPSVRGHIVTRIRAELYKSSVSAPRPLVVCTPDSAFLTMPPSDARRTIWVKEDTPPMHLANAAPGSSATSQSHAAEPSTGGKSNTSRDGKGGHKRPPVRDITFQSPLEIYIPRALIRAGHVVFLATRRDSPAEIVHIQQVETELALAKRGAQKLDLLAHHNFLRLLDVLHYRSTYYLIWEPAEFALDRVLLSRRYIHEDELGQIIRPGLALADLAPERIVITQEGRVKILDIECCRRITPSDMSAAGLKLTELQKIMDQMMQKTGAQDRWSDDVVDFAALLGKEYSDGHLERLLQHPLLRCEAGDGSLNALVNLVKKTTYHRVNYHPCSKSGNIRRTVHTDTRPGGNLASVYRNIDENEGANISIVDIQSDVLCRSFSTSTEDGASMARSSNEKRARRRQECREALANHIYNRLGLRIAPSKVRLQPSPDDGYAWSVTDKSAHLLRDSLSSGSVGQYEAICEGLGVSIEAVHPEVVMDDRTTHHGDDDEPSSNEESFTAIIQRLRVENEALTSEIDRLQHHIDINRELRSSKVLALRAAQRGR
ncbi:hypothetical protein GB937_001334 [Aspergillus fischeri]|nr:hypothetical protein GB937_001334 [Aspergillus fischeri]